jgi:nuclear transport factor 2 (NTF2) superfamily protein
MQPDRNLRLMDETTSRPPLPPFNAETAAQKVRMAEDAWNTREPARVALAYTVDSRWRNRSEFLRGRAAIEAFLTRKWSRELDYRLIKEVWTFRDNRIAVRFAMNGTTTAATGSAATATRTGSSTSTG